MVYYHHHHHHHRCCILLTMVVLLIQLVIRHARGTNVHVKLETAAYFDSRDLDRVTLSCRTWIKSAEYSHYRPLSIVFWNSRTPRQKRTVAMSGEDVGYCLSSIGRTFNIHELNSCIFTNTSTAVVVNIAEPIDDDLSRWICAVHFVTDDGRTFYADTENSTLYDAYGTRYVDELTGAGDVRVFPIKFKSDGTLIVGCTSSGLLGVNGIETRVASTKRMSFTVSDTRTVHGSFMTIEGECSGSKAEDIVPVTCFNLTHALPDKHSLTAERLLLCEDQPYRLLVNAELNIEPDLLPYYMGDMRRPDVFTFFFGHREEQSFDVPRYLVIERPLRGFRCFTMYGGGSSVYTCPYPTAIGDLVRSALNNLRKYRHVSIKAVGGETLFCPNGTVVVYAQNACVPNLRWANSASECDMNAGFQVGVFDGSVHLKTSASSNMCMSDHYMCFTEPRANPSSFEVYTTERLSDDVVDTATVLFKNSQFFLDKCPNITYITTNLRDYSLLVDLELSTFIYGNFIYLPNSGELAVRPVVLDRCLCEQEIGKCWPRTNTSSHLVGTLAVQRRSIRHHRIYDGVYDKLATNARTSNTPDHIEHGYSYPPDAVKSVKCSVGGKSSPFTLVENLVDNLFCAERLNSDLDVVAIAAMLGPPVPTLSAFDAADLLVSCEQLPPVLCDDGHSLSLVPKMTLFFRPWTMLEPLTSVGQSRTMFRRVDYPAVVSGISCAWSGGGDDEEQDGETVYEDVRQTLDTYLASTCSDYAVTLTYDDVRKNVRCSVETDHACTPITDLAIHNISSNALETCTRYECLPMDGGQGRFMDWSIRVSASEDLVALKCTASIVSPAGVRHVVARTSEITRGPTICNADSLKVRTSVQTSGRKVYITCSLGDIAAYMRCVDEVETASIDVYEQHVVAGMAKVERHSGEDITRITGGTFDLIRESTSVFGNLNDTVVIRHGDVTMGNNLLTLVADFRLFTENVYGGGGDDRFHDTGEQELENFYKTFSTSCTVKLENGGDILTSEQKPLLLVTTTVYDETTGRHSEVNNKNTNSGDQERGGGAAELLYWKDSSRRLAIDRHCFCSHGRVSGYSVLHLLQSGNFG